MTRVFAVIVMAALTARAYNHPEIRWQTVQTRHFSINYYAVTEPAVYPIAKMAEEAYESLSRLYSYTSPEKISISLADYDDFSNGLARWIDNSIVLWLPDMRFDLRGNTVWLRNVLIHELAHIMTLAKHPGGQWLYNVFDASYRAPGVGLRIQTPLPLTRFYPPWFAEGIAQVESERGGGDCWDSRRDMVLRCAILDGTRLSLAEMGEFNHTSMGNEMVYNQGYSLVRYIETRFGTAALAALWNEGRGWKPGSSDFSARFHRITKASLQSVYDSWISSAESDYKNRIPAKPLFGAEVWTQGFVNELPRISRDGSLMGWLTNDRDDFRRTDLIIVRTKNREPVARIKHAHTGWDFARDDSGVYYVKSREPDKNGSYYNDVYRFDFAQRRETRVTHNARVYDIASLPGGGLLCTRYSRGAFSIDRFDPASQSFTRIVESRMGEPFVGLSPSPDGKAFVVCRVVDGNADLVVYDITGHVRRKIAASTAQEETPWWGADGRIYFSADYDGIFNVYSVSAELDSSDTSLVFLRHTNVRGGAFAPVVMSSGGILYSEFGTGGYSIRTIQSPGVPFAIDSVRACTFLPLPRNEKIKLSPRPYQPRPLRRIWESGVSVGITDEQNMVSGLLTGRDQAYSRDSLGFFIAGQLGSSRSDALDKISNRFGVMLGAAVGGTDAIPQSSFSPGLFNSGVRRMTAGIGVDTLYTMRTLLIPRARSGEGNGLSDADTARRTMMPVMEAGYQVTNRIHGPTLGLFVGGMTDFSIILGQARLSALWRIHRDWQAGLAPTLYFIGVMPVGADLALGVSWVTYDYLNEDVSYNLRGVTSLFAEATPWYLPMYRPVGDSVDVQFTSGMSAQLGALHGIPLSRYSSLVLSAYGGLFGSAVIIRNPVFPNLDASDLYVTLNGSVQYLFPLVRTINRGRRLYADALYGTLFYSIDTYANRQGMAGAFYRAVSEPDIDPDNIGVYHRIGVGTRMGLTRSYLFFRKLTAHCAFDPFEQTVSVDIGLTF